MAESPNVNADGPLCVTLRCGGQNQPQLPLISVTVRHGFNTIPWARLVMADGDMPEQRFPLSDGELFKPGSEIVVHAGYGDEGPEIFSGIVVRHGVKISEQNDSRLVVECQGLAQDRPSLQSSSAALTLAWGVDLMSFDADIDAPSPSTAAPARVSGSMSFQGSALARPGALVELAAVGARFNGTVLLSAVEHEISAGNWISRAEFGREPQALAQQADVLAAGSDGKAIVTRCGHRIEFNDRDKIISITTPAQNRLVLDDAGQGIQLQDQHGNRLSLSAAGIELSSPKDIHISAKGGLSAKGAATAELSAAGQTTIKGGMVLIN